MSKDSLQRNLRLLAIFNFCTDFVLYAPVAILYFTKVSGSFALGMSIFSVQMIVAAAFQIPTGIFSDQHGRRKTLLAGSFFATIGAVSFALGQSYGMLIAGALLTGLARAFYSGNNEALLYETLAEHHQERQYHHYLGRTNSLFQVALAISAVVGSVIASWSFALVMWLSVIPQLIGLCVSYFFLEPQTHLKQKRPGFGILRNTCQQFYRNPKLSLLTVASVIGFSIGESAYQFRAAFVQLLWPIWAIGIANVISNIGAAISFYWSSKIMKKFPALQVLVLENISSRLLNIFSLIFPSIFSPMLMGLTSLTYGVRSVAESDLLQREFTDRERATLGSVNSLLGSLGFAIVAVVLGSLADHFSPTKTLLVANVMLFAPLLLWWKIGQHDSHPAHRSPR